MPRAWTQTTIETFKGLRYTDILNNAAIEDTEAAVIDNFVVTDLQTLQKRRGFDLAKGSIVPTATNPAAQPLTAPTTTVVKAIQRRATGSADRIWFTDVGQTDLWCADLPSFTNITRVLTPTNTSLTGVEWIIQAASSAAPYEIQGIRSQGASGGFGILNATPTAGIPAASPNGTHITLFKDRLFAINSLHTTGQESRLYWTDPPGYGSWAIGTNFIDIQPGNGEWLVATIVFNDQLLIFKSGSTWVLTADGLPSNWVLRNLHPQIGCVGRGTPLIISGFIYFLSVEGVYRTDGTTFEKISNAVDPYINNGASFTPASCLNINAYYLDNKYYLFAPTTGSGVTQPLIYDIQNDLWTRWVFGGSPQINVTQGTVYPEINTPKLYSGSVSTASIYSHNQSSSWQDNGGNYICKWRSKRFTWGDPTVYKRNFAFMLDVGYTINNVGAVTVVHSVDNNNLVAPFSPTIINTTAVNTYDTARKEMKYQGAGYARAMYTEVTYTNNDSFDIFKVSWLNKTKDTVNKSN